MFHVISILSTRILSKKFELNDDLLKYGLELQTTLAKAIPTLSEAQRQPILKAEFLDSLPPQLNMALSCVDKTWS